MESTSWFNPPKGIMHISPFQPFFDKNCDPKMSQKSPSWKEPIVYFFETLTGTFFKYNSKS